MKGVKGYPRKVPDEVAEYIVGRFAMWETPDEIAGQIKDLFNVEFNKQTICQYNMSRPANKHMGRKWHEMFAAARERFLTNIYDIPLANKAYRLKFLDEMAHDAKKSKNRPLASQIAEQAAKEVGDAYSSKRKIELTGKDGGAMEFSVQRLLQDLDGNSVGLPRLEDLSKDG